MEKIHVGKGVYRSLDNTQLFEVFTDEQMRDIKAGKAYDVMNRKKQVGGVHGIKVLAKKNKHKRVEYENANLIRPDQFEIIKQVVGMINPPEVDYNYGEPKPYLVHDHSKDAQIKVEDGLPAGISEGTNLGEIDPITGEPYEDEEDAFSEDLIGDDYGDDDGFDEDESGTDGKNGKAFSGAEYSEQGTESESGGEYSAESDKEYDPEPESIS